MTVRVRFAPSPTGFMHLGNARTALFNWLYAKHMGGKFLLRIEDTDRERSTEEAVQVIFDSLKWLGFHWDEEVVFQTHHLERYQEIADQLLANGQAYKCFCTKEELVEMREKMRAETGGGSRYDRRWRDRTDHPEDGTPFTIRFRTPLDGSSEINDAVQGDVKKQQEELDDFIMVRETGIPTYQFAVVVDDHDMDITHVIRGADHVDNTHDQLNLYKALGWKAPIFAHAPRILGLSKRKGSPSVGYYRNELGLLREGLVNYLVRLGWSHGDQELFTMEELIAAFDLEHIHSSNGNFDEVKLAWVNEQQLRSLPLSRISEECLPLFKAKGFEVEEGPWFDRLLDVLRVRASNIYEIVDASAYFFEEITGYDERAAKKNLKRSVAPHLLALANSIEGIEEWNEANIETCIQGLCTEREIKFGKIAQPSRVALTGLGRAPGIYEIFWLVGKDRSAARLRAAASWIEINRGA